LFRAPVVGLLVAVGTAASLMVSDLHGLMILMMVACAALAAGAVAYAEAVKKVCDAYSEPLRYHSLLSAMTLDDLANRPVATTSLPPSS